jgi:TPR repeat protein
MRNCGFAFEKRYNIKPNLPEAIKCHEISADLGNSDEMFNNGCARENDTIENQIFHDQ